MANPPADEPAAPSHWVTSFAGLLRGGVPVLDVACGNGRNGRFFHARGHPTTFLDIDVSGVRDLEALSDVEIVAADIEGGSWPLHRRTFGAVIVVNYLWRPAVPAIVAALAPGGVLLYETFAVGNEAYGRPRNPDFLLRPGELLEAVRGHCLVHAYACGYHSLPRPRVTQALAAVRPNTGA